MIKVGDCYLHIPDKSLGIEASVYIVTKVYQDTKIIEVESPESSISSATLVVSVLESDGYKCWRKATPQEAAAALEKKYDSLTAQIFKLQELRTALKTRYIMLSAGLTTNDA